MPRLSLSREDIDVLMNLLDNNLIGLNDDEAQATDDGDLDGAREIHARWERQREIAWKLQKAKGA